MVRGAQALVHARTQHAHRALLEPAVLLAAQDHGELRRVGLLQPREQRFADHVRGEVLLLDEDEAPGLGDRIQHQRLDLAHRLAPAIGGLGAADAELDVAKLRLAVVRPAVVRLDRGGFARALAGGAEPALARELAVRRRGRPVEHHLHVVEGRVLLAGRVAAQRIVRAVALRIPAAAREVEPAHERDLVVHHDDLLVMAGRDRVRGVEAELQPLARAELVAEHGQPLAIEREHHREVPAQHVHAELAPAPDQCLEELAQRLGPTVLRAARNEAGAAVDVPGDDLDAALRAHHGLARRGEVGAGVDQEADPVRALDAPAVAPGLQQRRRRGFRFGHGGHGPDVRNRRCARG